MADSTNENALLVQGAESNTQGKRDSTNQNFSTVNFDPLQFLIASEGDIATLHWLMVLTASNYRLTASDLEKITQAARNLAAVLKLCEVSDHE